MIFCFILKYPIYDPDSDKNVALIQQEIMENGPVEATYWVFSDFVNEKNAI